MRRILLSVMLGLMIVYTGMAEPEEKAKVFATEQFPEYTFLDGCMFDETAMLLLEDEQGKIIFVGCVWDGEKWGVTLSTPFPDWLSIALDTYHASDGSMRLWISRVPELREYEDEILDIYIGLQQDGTWSVYGVNNGGEVIEFRRQSIYEVCGYEYFCDVDIPLDITKIDWALLPRSFHQAMDILDTSRWMLVACKYAPMYAGSSLESVVLSLGAAGAPVQVVSDVEGMVQVRFIGCSDTGWMLKSDLIPGSEQIGRYDIWCEDGFTYGAREMILDSTDSTVSWYAVPHDESTAEPFIIDHVEYVTVLGWCTDLCCCHLYSETLGTSGFVQIDQQSYTIE